MISEKIKKQLANIFTLSNLTLGLVSIVITAAIGSFPFGRLKDPFQPYLISTLLIIIAACLDRFDGKIARKMNSVSDLGKQLDSLCDLVSFGVAPAIVTWKLQLSLVAPASPALYILLYTAVLLFPLCGALRLAKFNVQEDTSYFVGIPITMAGGLVALFQLLYLLFVREKQNLTYSIIILIVVLLLAILMVSPFKMKKR